MEVSKEESRPNEDALSAGASVGHQSAQNMFANMVGTHPQLENKDVTSKKR